MTSRGIYSAICYLRVQRECYEVTLLPANLLYGEPGAQDPAVAPITSDFVKPSRYGKIVFRLL